MLYLKAGMDMSSLFAVCQHYLRPLQFLILIRMEMCTHSSALCWALHARSLQRGLQ